MAAELVRPGVQVIQTFKNNPPTFLRPTLVPIVVGPAFEIVNVLNSDGTVNQTAKYGTYSQLPITITQSSFPNPRNNISQLVVQTATVRPFMQMGGSLSELLMNVSNSPPVGTSTLAMQHLSSKAAIQTAAFNGATGLALIGKVLVLAIDQSVRTSTSKDVTVTFTAPTVGASVLLSSDCANQINAAVGQTVATVVGTAPSDKVQISSLTYGALSSVTVRQGGSANTLLQIGFSGASAAHEERIEGSGFRAQDQANGTTQSPFVEFYTGAYILDGVATAIVPKVGLINILTVTSSVPAGVFSSALATAVTFGPTGTIPLQVGDLVFADGAKLLGGEVIKVESSRFKMGTINTTLSTVDANGRYTVKVYNLGSLGTVLDPSPFAPKYTYFVANNINWTTAVPVAASVSGTLNGSPATVASILGSTITGPFSVAGLVLNYSVTINGVVTNGTFTFTGGPYADPTALATYLNNPTGASPAVPAIPGVAFSAQAVNTKLQMATVLTGATQALTILATGTANSTIGFTGAFTATGTDVTFPAMVVTSGQVSPSTALFAGGAKTLVVKISTDGGVTFPTTQTHTFTADGATSALVTQLNADAAFTTIASVLTLVAEQVGSTNEIRIKHTSTAANVVLKVDATSTGLVAGGLSYTAAQTGYALNGQKMTFQLNQNPHNWTLTFASNSLVQAIADTNNLIGGLVPVAIASTSGSNSDLYTLTTNLKGLAGSVQVISGQAAATLGLALNASPVLGTGRPFPDAYIDTIGNLNIGSSIMRDAVTGFPLDQATNNSTLFIQFNALRQDVSPLATVVGVIRMSDPTVLSTTLNPLTDQNPLGLATFLCMLNAPGVEVKALGVDEVTGSAPNGSIAAYTRAAALLEAEEVYAIAPLTQDEVTIQMWINHVVAMSDPAQGGERILLANRVTPTRKNSAVAASGSSANSTATANQIQIDTSPQAGLVAAGINPAQPFTVAMGVYVEFTDNNNVFQRYNVASVSGSILNLNTTFAATDNTDAFYSTTSYNSVLLSVPYSLKVRGTVITVAGSNPPRPDYSQLAQTIGDANALLKNRRVFSVFPDTVQTTVSGLTKKVPGFYACACIAGMVSSQPPQQPFTNFPIAGLVGVNGTEKYSKHQLNAIAGGGTYVLMQEVPGASVTCRHQLSTDLTSIPTREMSITKVIDFVTKFLRIGVRKYIGTEVITSQLLDTIGTTIHGMLKFLEEAGILIGSKLNTLVQDINNPDTILIDITLQVPFPCNYIKITLEV